MKTTLVVLIHGFNVSDGGKATVGKLRPYFLSFPGTKVIALDYGYFGLLSTRFFNEEVAENLAKIIIENFVVYDRIVVVGHSNGCAIAHMASQKLPKPVYVDRYVYINPALKADLLPSGAVQSLDIYHNPDDQAVVFSKLLFWNASERPWGKMGNTGYQGITNPRVYNINTSNLEVPALGHSGVFKASVLHYYGPFIAKTSLRSL